MSMTDRLTAYNQRISSLTGKKLKLEKQEKHLPLLRLVFFILFLFLVYSYLSNQSDFVLTFAISSLLAFIVASIADSRLKAKIDYFEILIGINRKEVTALGGNSETFDPGSEFVDQSHDYTHDLDIFGKGSLFQFVNRTATIYGKIKLADYLSSAFKYSDHVKVRQESVHELAELIDFRQQIQLIFHGEQISPTDQSEIAQWIESENPVGNLKLLKILAYGLPSVTLLFMALSIAGILSFPVLLIVLQLIIVFLYGKKTIKVHESITSKSKILNRYAKCMKLIEITDFKSRQLTDIQGKLTVNPGQSPSKSIHRLSTILKYMDSNLNLLVSVILNGLFMFNLHLLLKVENWKKRNAGEIPIWFEAIATFDALASLANFNYNHPQYVFPELLTGEFSFVAHNLGHPLIEPALRVVNDIEIRGWNQFYIITGANMSGKSTFLRTLGVNYILAMAGAPVCARKLQFYPIQLHSSIRTSDSLVKHESYFYAELKRLKEIIEELESGKEKLILLDEILKGTNSKDKQAGSIALIEQLLNYKSVGLFATHDLMLGELANRYPGHVNNLCFEIEIAGDKMVIDYKLHKGVCKNLNATYLMRNMGILFENEISL
jgi:hypothetical protein